MDNEIRDSAAGRDANAHDAGDDPATPCDRASAGPAWPDTALNTEELKNTLAALDKFKEPERYAFLSKLLANRLEGIIPDPATAPATRPTKLTPTAAGFRIRFCTWCKQVDVRGPRRETDVITILIIGKKILAAWNGDSMIVQDGICEACADCLKNGRVIDGSTTL